MVDDALILRTASRSTSKEVMLGMLEASSEACWCMEFGLPVDVTAPDTEIVRQVFENDPYWSFANPAMAQLYLMPEGAFTDRPVAEVFPRNRQNEEFVLNLIANGFEVDAAPALDTRYDGVEIEVENDVRAHIENGRLLRMFGNVRDIGKHRRRESALLAQLDLAQSMLNALAAPALAFDGDGVIIGANAAASDVLRLEPADMLGNGAITVLRDVGDELAARIESLLRRPFAMPESGEIVAIGHRWRVSAPALRGSVVGIVSALPLQGAV